MFIATAAACSQGEERQPDPPSVKPLTYQEVLSKFGLQPNVYYNYKDISGVQNINGQIKFNSDLTISENYNGQIVQFKYKFESNNGYDNSDLTATFTAENKDIIPHYDPKMPVTSLAKHQVFQLSLRSSKLNIGGLYAYADPSMYWKFEILK